MSFAKRITASKVLAAEPNIPQFKDMSHFPKLGLVKKYLKATWGTLYTIDAASNEHRIKVRIKKGVAAPISDTNILMLRQLVDSDISISIAVDREKPGQLTVFIDSYVSESNRETVRP